jgi:hypothetical protein
MNDLIITQYQLSLIIKNETISENLREMAYSELLQIGLKISALEANNEHTNNTDSAGGKVQRQVHFN